ncbi:MAG TPA: hypothetical protein VGC20_17160 [bacterium]|jgi:uncharacterized tellurite resistance protein B-like protein
MAHTLRTPIETMNDHQREWFATAMVSMVLADGNVTQGEAQSLMQSIAFVRNAQLVETLKKYIAYQTVPNLTAFVGWEDKLKNRALMMLDLMDVAIADRDFSPKERDQFLLIGKVLGFPRPKVEELIAMGEKATESIAS